MSDSQSKLPYQRFAVLILKAHQNITEIGVVFCSGGMVWRSIRHIEFRVWTYIWMRRMLLSLGWRHDVL